MSTDIAAKQYTNQLKTLGLTGNESLVYLEMLKLGETGTSKIAQGTSLHGQLVYNALDKLVEKGLATYTKKRGRRKYRASSPNILLRKAREQEALADSLVHDLAKLATLPPEQSFVVHQGTDAYVEHEFEILRAAQPGSELLIVGGAGDHFNEHMGTRLGTYTQLQVKKKVTIRYIGSEESRKQAREQHGGRRDFDMRYLPGLFTGQVNTNIWPDAIGFNIYGAPVTRFTVYGKELAESYALFFESLWKLAKE